MATSYSNLIKSSAKAIFNLGSHHNCLREYLILLEHFSEIVNLKTMRHFIKNNWIDPTSKANSLVEITQDLIKYANLSLDELSLIKFNSIIQWLNQQKNLLLLPKILLAYEKLYLITTNSLKVTIITAVAIAADLSLSIHQHLAQHFNKNLRLNYEIDPSVLAGLIIKYQDQVIDYSFKNKLLQLQQNLNRHHDGEYSVKC